MKWSQISLQTLRENPADAEMESHRLLVRGGLIKKLAPGIFSYGVLFLRSIRKFENIIREELAKVGAGEILMPMVQPAEIWQKSGRWPHMTELLKFKNKNQQDFCLGATHEEAVVQFALNDVKSYKNLPLNLFQIQTKYRDEIRPRFGLMRGREFIMKDAYTFDRSKEEALKNYEAMYAAYEKIFQRLGVNYTVVQADSGAIGGDKSNEFQVLADGGMDSLLLCEGCGYSGNVEVVPVSFSGADAEPSSEAMEKFATPGLRTIEDLAKSLGCEPKVLVKTFFVKFQDKKKKWKTATLLVPGHREVNFIKAKTAIGAFSDLEPLNESEVKKLTCASPGSCGPVGLDNLIIMDKQLRGLPSFVVGANEDDFHLKNVVEGRDFNASKVADLSEALPGDSCPKCEKPLASRNGIEVGHIFYLGQKYAEPMGLKFLDENGKAQNVEMGCYGIGVTRSLQSVIEQNHDGDGMIWPQSVAPFHVHICMLDPGEPAAESLCETVETALNRAGFEVFVDDRKERPGIKFKDADLLGLPLRLVIGRRGLDNNEVEIVARQTKEKSVCAPEDASEKLLSLLKGGH